MDIGGARNDEEREATDRLLNSEISAVHAGVMDAARTLDTKGDADSRIFSRCRPVSAWDTQGAALVGRGVRSLASIGRLCFCTLAPDTELSGAAALGSELEGAKPLAALGQIVGAKIELHRMNARLVHAKAAQWRLSILFLSAGTVFTIWSVMVEGPK